jgi:glutamate-ammonia-ligase adenylyltransferase
MNSLLQRARGPWPKLDEPAGAATAWSELPSDIASRLRPAQPLLDAIFSASPYLRSLVLNDPEFAAHCLEGNPEEKFAILCSELIKDTGSASVEEAGLFLRKAKGRAALLLALADTARVWTVEEVTSHLTDFADTAVQCAVTALLREAHEQGRLYLPDPAHPTRGCGYTVLAMGKHGAHELNYSSDIDLIVLFDPEAPAAPQDGDAGAPYIRITKRLVALLQDIDENGYVFRTDLRLRPDPRATQVAISIEAAAVYYENLGQNWERAAYIKARAIAGDIGLGEEFLKRLQPYIWRKYLDFAAIADVQSLIRQIHAVKGHGEIAVMGHNLKLGRGGIREIEFFVQTQQLIAGGRNPALRGRSTLAMLDGLAAAQWITPTVAEDLKRCYRLLRMFEHRAQMMDDQQTHNVPATAEAFARYARFCGYDSEAEFSTALRAILETVQRHSSRLFETSKDLGAEGGSLVFTGGEDDPDTLETLTRMGFSQASEVSATIRGWHFGRYPATRTRRAREDLTELMPALLQALARDGDAGRAFVSFDQFISGLGSGVQLFAMIKANPGVLDLLAKILGTAPRLAEELSRRPRILEAVLDPDFFGSFPARARLEEQATSLMPPGLPLEELMDRARLFAREQKFRVGVQVLSDTLSAEEAGRSFSNIAEVVISHLLAAVEADMVARHGKVDGGQVAIIAMGKLGGGEMTSASDLDLILIYDHAAEAQASDGAKPLSPTQYYQRLTQRLITALTAPTPEGELYEVDMRLRPSGSKGPVAASLSSFKSYHADEAWTWERLALTRARVVAGSNALSATIAATVAATLTRPRDTEKIRADVLEMRGLMLAEHKPDNRWDVKRSRGGLVELEFIAQFLQLTHATGNPQLLHSNTGEALQAALAAGHLSRQQGDQLLAAGRLFHRLTQVLRLCLSSDYDPAKALSGLNRAVAQAAGAPDIHVAEALLKSRQDEVAQAFDALIGIPASK